MDSQATGDTRTPEEIAAAEAEAERLKADAEAEAAKLKADLEADAAKAELELHAGETEIVDDVKPKAAMMQEHIATLSPAQIFGSIEEGALFLLKLIEAIPNGISHGYHTLAAEIRSRI